MKVIYTLLGCCRPHGLLPFDYLKDLFTRLPAAKITQIKEFTPAVCAKANDKILAQADKNFCLKLSKTFVDGLLLKK